MKPLTLDFPHRVTIELPGHVRKALREVADREPHENDEVLLLRVLSRGIVATIAAEIEREGDEELEKRLHELRQGAESKLPAREASPFAAPSVRFRQKQKQRLEQAEADIAASKGPGEAATPTPGTSVERYLAAPISEELRERFEDYVNAHQMAPDDALTTLLRQGLDATNSQGGGESGAEQRAEKTLRIAERLYERARRRCGF